MQPFKPAAGATVSINVSAVSQRAVIVGGPASVRIFNDGTETAWINFGDDTVTAAVAGGMPIGPGVTEVVSAGNPNGAALNVAAIGAGSTGKIYFTPGSGL